MITLYQFPSRWDLPNSSVFCFKVETYLRMAGIEYKVKIGSPPKAPKGKLPYIKDSKTGQTVSDSSDIIEYLKATYGDTLDAHLTAQQRAQGHMLSRMLEEHTYWALLHARWIDERGWSEMSVFLSELLPPVLGALLKGVLRKGIRKSLHAQGTGRHTPEEIWKRAKLDLDALIEQLGDNDFILGAEPSSFDAIAYTSFVSFLVPPIENPLQTHLQNNENVKRYVERVKARYFSDWSAPQS